MNRPARTESFSMPRPTRFDKPSVEVRIPKLLSKPPQRRDGRPAQVVSQDNPIHRMSPAKLPPGKAPPGRLGKPERIALFVTALHRARAEELLAGLAGEEARRATRFMGRAQKWDSPTRQAAVALEFGVRVDVEARLKEMLGKLPLKLQVCVISRLPEWQQSFFPKLLAQARTSSHSPALIALADRLVREATR